MAATQKKWLSAPKGKLSKADLPAVLRQEHAWALLPRETRQELYNLLPPLQAGEDAYDVDVHPLNTRLRPYIEDELRRWQDDLIDGKETKAWRDQAMEAGKERREGKWDEWKNAQRDSEWAKDDGENMPPENDAGGEEADDGNRDESEEVK